MIPTSYELDHVLIMRKQEETIYLYSRYFPKAKDKRRDDGDKLFNEEWRETISEYLYRFVDCYEIPREMVSISMCYFDRYCATRANRCSREETHLAAVTSLYLAIKIHNTQKLMIQDLVRLTKGQFGVHEFKTMERDILSALRWRMNPPTPTAFIQHLLDFLPSSQVDPSLINYLYQVSQYLVELSVCDSYFVWHKPSSVAFASILVALEKVCHNDISEAVLCTFVEHIAIFAKIHYNCSDVANLRARLRELYSESEEETQNYAESTPVVVDSNLSLNSKLSPTSVTESIIFH